MTRIWMYIWKLSFSIVWLLHTIILGAQFGPPKLIDPILDNATEAIVVDLNLDGLDDILVIAEDETGYFLNLGGEYTERLLITDAYSEPRDCEVADIDGDGFVDVIVSYDQPAVIVWFANDGDGLFAPAETIVSDVQATSLVLGPLNDDGQIDLLYYDNLSSSVFSLMSSGGGDFESPELVIEDQANHKALNLADMNADGLLDLVGPCTASLDLGIHWGQGDGSFIEEILTLGINGRELVVIEDLIGDQHLDITIAANNGVLGIIENLGEEEFSVFTQIDVVPSPNSLLVDDVTSDGLADILCTSANDFDVRLFENGDEGFLEPQVLNPDHPVVSRCMSLVMSNLGSGLLIEDLNGMAIIPNTGSFDFGNAESLTTNAKLNSELHIADLDGDGFEDIVGFSETHLWVMYGDGVAGFGEKQMIEEVSLPHIGVTSLDVDEDGWSDIVYVAGNDSEARVIFQVGYREWSQSETIFEFDSIDQLGSADIDGNGLDDVWLKSGLAINLKLAIGNQQFDSESRTFELPNWTDLKFYDGDNDGDLDLYLYGGDVAVAEYDAALQVEQFISGGFVDIVSIEFGDFSDDGISDLVEVTSAGAVNILSGLGELTYLPLLSGGVIPNPQKLVVSDVDSDSFQDVIVSTLDGNLLWIRNNMSIDFDEGQLVVQSASNLDFEVLDVEKDGDEDILIILESERRVLLYENYHSSATQFKGHSYVDFNGDGLQDPEDVSFPFVKIRFSGLEPYFYSDLNGNYTTYSDTGFFEVYPEFDESLFSISTGQSSYSATLSEEDPVSTGNDFGFTPSGWQEKINGEFVTQPPRCDQVIRHQISVHNEGNLVPSGVLAYELDELCSFVSADPLPDSTDGNKIYFSYNELFFFNHESFEVQVQMPSAEEPMPWLTHYLTIYATDEFEELFVVDVDSLSEQLLCSFDPNDKLEEIGYTPKGFITPDDTLEYTIRFQNTGNDTAYDVMIRDALPNYIDRSTINPIDWSHPFELYIENDGEVVFEFEDIYLPDSLANESQSQGYIKFEAQPIEGILNGAKIYNEAQIYFDQNVPITTNTFVNEIYDCDIGIDIILNQGAFCLGDTLEAAHGYKGLSTIDWQFSGLTGSDSIFCTVVNEPGDFQLLLTSQDPLCGARQDSMLIMVGELIQPDLLMEPDPICEGDSVLLVSNYAEGNNWFLSNEPLGDDPYLLVSTQGVYDLQISNNGCTSPFLSIEVEVNATPMALISAEDTLICQGQSTHLFANEANSYQWFIDGEVVGDDAILELDQPSQVFLQVETEDCVSDPDSVTIAGLPTPIAFASGSLEFCEGDSTLLTSLSSDSSLWFAGGELLSSGPEFLSDSAGDYSLVVLGEWCESIPHQFSLLEIERPTAFIFQNEVAFCPGSSIVIEAGPFDLFEWYLGNQLIGQDDEQEFNEIGNYALLVSEDGCWSEPFHFEVSELESAPIPAIFESGNSLICNVAGANYDHLWLYNDIPIANSNDQIYYPQTSGNYRVQLEDENGCSSISDPFEFIFTHVLDQNPGDLHIYPNPTDGHVRLNWPKRITGQVELLNSLGQLVRAEKLINSQLTNWDLSGLAKGTYVVRWSDEQTTQYVSLVLR